MNAFPNLSLLKDSAIKKCGFVLEDLLEKDTHSFASNYHKYHEYTFTMQKTLNTGMGKKEKHKC